MKRRQTSLPQSLTTNAGVGDGFAYGFTHSSPLPVRPEQSENEPARVTDFRQHRFNSRTVIVNATAQIVSGSNVLRRFISFQNNGTVAVFLGFGIPSSLTGENSFVLAVNGYLSFEFGVVPNNEIWAVSSVACDITIIEGGIM